MKTAAVVLAALVLAGCQQDLRIPKPTMTGIAAVSGADHAIYVGCFDKNGMSAPDSKVNFDGSVECNVVPQCRDANGVIVPTLETPALECYQSTTTPTGEVKPETRSTDSNFGARGMPSERGSRYLRQSITRSERFALCCRE